MHLMGLKYPGRKILKVCVKFAVLVNVVKRKIIDRLIYDTTNMILIFDMEFSM